MTQFYIVNGERMNTSKAALMLGYKNSTGLMYRIKSNGIPEGGDISHLHTCRSKIFIVNGQEVNITAAAHILGYDQSTLSRKIASLSLPEGRIFPIWAKLFTSLMAKKWIFPAPPLCLGTIATGCLKN